MSVYNGEPYLREAVRSVLTQSFSDFDFLIFDDHSQDGTSEILNEFCDSRITIITNSTNEGLTKNLARGMNIAEGEFIARMDADDICEPHRLQTQVDYLDSNRHLSVVGSAVTFFDESGREFVAYQPENHNDIQCALFFGFTMLHPSVMLRRADFQRNSLNYDPYFICSQDHDLWVRASRLLRFANIRNPLLKMREHPMKIGRTRNALQRQLSQEIRERQLHELSVSWNNDEFSALNRAAHGDLPTSLTDLRCYESLLLKVFSGNDQRNIFHQATLETSGARCFRNWCRSALTYNHAHGRYYWRSPMRRFDRLTVREKSGLLLRSAFPFLP